MRVMTRALLIGRFQPFHRGHKYLLDTALKKFDEVVIAICSAQESYDFDNPLTSSERMEMLWNYIKKRKLTERVIIVPVEDIHQNRLWARHVCTIVPEIDAVYTNNKLVSLLFKYMDVKVIETGIKGNYSGTKIRTLIRDGKSWKEFVPDDVYEFISGIDMVRRLI